jgi:hypothetical protein
MDALELPQGDLSPVEGEGLPTALLDAIGIQPVVVKKLAAPEEAQAAFATDLARLSQEKPQQPGGE